MCIYICTVHQINSNPPCYKTPTKWTSNRWVKSAYSVLHVAVCSSPFPSTSMSWLSQTETFFCHPYRTPKIYDSHTHGIRVWYIYLHLVDFYGKCRWICHTWILWDILRIKQAISSTILEGILFSPFSIHYCQGTSSSTMLWDQLHSRRCLQMQDIGAGFWTPSLQLPSSYYDPETWQFTPVKMQKECKGLQKRKPW